MYGAITWHQCGSGVGSTCSADSASSTGYIRGTDTARAADLSCVADSMSGMDLTKVVWIEMSFAFPLGC